MTLTANKTNPDIEAKKELDGSLPGRTRQGLGRLSQIFVASLICSLGPSAGHAQSSNDLQTPPIPADYDPWTERGANAFLAHHGIALEDLSVSAHVDPERNRVEFQVMVEKDGEEVAFQDAVSADGWDLRGGSTLNNVPGSDRNKWYQDLWTRDDLKRVESFAELSKRLPDQFYVSIELFGYDDNGVEFYLGASQIKSQQFDFHQLVGDAEIVEIRSPANEESTLEEPKQTQQIQYSWPGLKHAWVTHGEDKVTQDELRAENGEPRNSLWDGRQITITGAKNDVVAFNIVLEAPSGPARNIEVDLPALTHSRGYTIDSREAEGAALFDYRDRPIELFVLDYLQIKGLSQIAWETYDERHIPEQMRRPFSGEGHGSGGWEDRPNHDKFYPDIAVPIEAAGSFSIEPGQNQSVWVDVFIPKEAPSGTYRGEVQVLEDGRDWKTIPVELTVRDFTLPDEPAVDTMIHVGQGQVKRHLGFDTPSNEAEWEQVRELRDSYFQMLHRHGLSGIGDDARAWNSGGRHPSVDWKDRLSGELFTEAHGYEGIGEGVSNGIYSVGTYGTWDWKSHDLSTKAGRERAREAMWQRTDEWMEWFRKNAPETEVLLYLADESSEYEKINTWAGFMNDNPGIGREMNSFATLSLPQAMQNVPELDIAATQAGSAGVLSEWRAAAEHFEQNDEKDAYFYNGVRPRSGTLMIEDEGTSVRMLPLVTERMNLDRWFYWESTYWENFQGGEGHVNVMERAHTFGAGGGEHAEFGESGYGYSNGDGVLFYPGTDRVFPEESLDLPGPIASVRLKLLRRGVLDASYVQLAEQIDPRATQAVLQELMPEVLWEMGVSDDNDPTWLRSDISWPTDPEVWEQARLRLADIIEG